jgi:hypothetical protein
LLFELPVPRSSQPPVDPTGLLSTELDRVVQARFGSVTKQEEEEGRLGVSRMLMPTHRQKVFAVRSSEERKVLDRLTENGWRVTLWVQPPMDGDALIGPIQMAQEAVESDIVRPEILRAALQALRSRGAILALSGTSREEARPVPASSAECLRCHTRSRLGDPLGAMVYVFTPG